MKKDVKIFKLRLWIKDKESEEILELIKSENLEIRWRGGLGKVEKEVIFKKDGKDYRILLKVFLEKYLLGTRNVVRWWKFFVPFNSPYEIYRGYMGEPNSSPEKDKERQRSVILFNEWNWGRITIFLFISIFVFVIYLIWIVKKKFLVKSNFALQKFKSNKRKND